MTERRSLLQLLILARLREQPAESVTALAESVGSERSAVTRSLRRLSEQGLVERRGRSWHLCEAGELEATEAAARIEEGATSGYRTTARKIDALSRLGSTDAPEAIAEGIGRPWEAALGTAILRSLGNEVSGVEGPMTHGIAWEAQDLSARLRRSSTTGLTAINEDLASYAASSGADLAAGSLISDAAQAVMDTSIVADGRTTLDRFIEGEASRAEFALGDVGMADAPAILDAWDNSTLALAAEGLASAIADDRTLVGSVGLGEAVVGSLSQALVASFDVGTTAMIAAQEHFSSVLAQAGTTLTSIDVGAIAQQTGLFAEAMDHFLGLRVDVSTGLSGDVVAPPHLPEYLISITSSYADLLRAENARGGVALVDAPALTEQWLWPTIPVAGYAGAVRSWFGSEVKPDEPRVESLDQRQGADLDARLAALNPDFVEMRRGAWHALRVNGPDRLRHAGTSHRELMTQVLRHLVPASRLPVDRRRGPEVKERVRLLFAGEPRKAAFAREIAQGLYAAYDELNSYTHGARRDEASLRYLLQTTEGLLGFILVNLHPEHEG